MTDPMRWTSCSTLFLDPSESSKRRPAIPPLRMRRSSSVTPSSFLNEALTYVEGQVGMGASEARTRWGAEATPQTPSAHCRAEASHGGIGVHAHHPPLAVGSHVSHPVDARNISCGYYHRASVFSAMPRNGRNGWTVNTMPGERWDVSADAQYYL